MAPGVRTKPSVVVWCEAGASRRLGCGAVGAPAVAGPTQDACRLLPRTAAPSDGLPTCTSAVVSAYTHGHLYRYGRF